MGARSFFTDSEIQSDPELSTLIGEILSLKSERRDLIGSLTPGISRWVDEISRVATSSVRANVDCKEPFGILEDVEELGQRMLSMSHFLFCSNSHIPLYKADELVSTSTKLMEISKGFYESTEQAMDKAVSEAAEAEEKRKEEERKEEKKKRDRMRKKEKKKQQQHKEKDEEDKKKRAMMRKKEKERKKKKKQQQEEEEEEDAQVITSEKVTEKMERKEEEEEEDEEETRRQQEVRKIMAAHEFLRLSSNVLARPLCYRNELAMMITEEDEQEYERVMEAERQAAMEAEEAKREAVRKAEKERERRREMSKQRKAEKEAKRKQIPQNKAPVVEKEERIVKEHADEQEAKSPAEQRIVEEHADEQQAKSPAEQLKERMDNQLGLFAGRRRAWEYSSGSKPGQCGGFQDKTLLSSMQFTHCIPGIIPPRAAVIESSLQIYSFKITGLSGDLKWPLNVYGVVAARDTVDHNRNLLFSRSSVMYQVLTSENDCSLCLIGPSRAILAVDPVDFEVELRVHDGYDFRGDGINDRELICVSNRYEGAPSGEIQRLTLYSPLCRGVLSLERLSSTVQATILLIRVVGEGHPFKSGGEVFCWSSSADGSAAIHEKVVLLHSLEGIPQEDDELDLDGYLPLSRNVVSVESGGGLNVVVETYGGSSTSTHVYFPCEYCNISQRSCLVGGSEVEITVAWSRLVRDKMDLLIDGYTTQA
ncbi:conglutin alpha 2-like [Triticum dicoccoides]|uniref:conglutin alpha 2-like n=1 Tax=Triticum dicoccoides TaxID=85692 RepID=UPI001890052C|nr:conglutin alpha 2-like [Triticum dicoccoides]